MKKNIKIAIDIRMSNKTGIGTYINTIIPSIIKHFNDAMFYLISNNEILFERKYHFSNVKSIIINSKVYSIAEQFILIKSLPRDLQLYWSPHYVFPIKIKSKILLTVHDTYHLSESTSLLKRLYSKVVFYFIKQNVTKIISVSNTTKKNIVKLTNIENSKIYTIYNGINPIFKSKNKTRDIILCVSNLKLNKNIIILLKAFELIESIIDYDLFIIGEYKNIHNKDKIALKMIKNNSRIHLIGILSKNQLMEYYNKSILYVHPSKYEGFGYPPIEAMTCGCPVIVSKSSCLPEICKNGAYYFNYNDYKQLSILMLKILSDKNMQNKIIKNGNNIAESYLVDITINKTINIIERLIN